MRYLILLVLLLLLAGCRPAEVWEYRVFIDEPDGSTSIVYGAEAPRATDGLIAIESPDGGRHVPADKVTWKHEQIGPHQCECGKILRTYRDECGNCGRQVLFGSRNPPDHS